MNVDRSRDAEGDEVLVVGGGIAGLSAAFHLSAAGSRVRLLEREPVLAAHASGRNAAIFRHIDGDPASTQLALRSRELLERLPEPGRLLRRTGALYLGSRDRLQPLLDVARSAGLAAELVRGRAALARLAPAVERGDAELALFVPEDGILDGHALVHTLAREARRQGATIETGVGVVAILPDADGVIGVRLAGGRRIAARRVVLAAGAWSDSLAATCGASARLRPLRRHLLLLESDEPVADSRHPVVWSLDPEVYFRPESGGVLASPCDEDPWRPEVPEVAGDEAERVAHRLARVSPVLLEARVRTSWACLRTFAPDRDFVVGRDRHRRGLFWIAGLGGRGMTCGFALGERLARAVLEREPTPMGPGG